MDNIFKKVENLMKMGRIVQERIQNGKLVIPKDTDELKLLIKMKADELAYGVDENGIVKVEQEEDEVIIYDMLTLLYILMDKLESKETGWAER